MTRQGFVLYFLMTSLTTVFPPNSHAELNIHEREELLLDDDDINHLLSEMHDFLVTIQQVTEGLENDDMNQIIYAANASGTASVKNISENLKFSLPMEFKKMGFATRKKFDQIALDAKQFGDKDHTLSQLNQVLTLCTNCHSRYRVE